MIIHDKLSLSSLFFYTKRQWLSSLHTDALMPIENNAVLPICNATKKWGIYIELSCMASNGGSI